MVADVRLEMKIDPTVDVAPTPEFNDAAQAMVMDTPQAQMANNVNMAPNLGANFQMATTLEVAAPEAIQDYGPQTVQATINPELMRGCENATMLPEIQPNLSANDSLLGAFCTITEEFSQDIAELSQAVGMGKKASLGSSVMEQQQAMQQTYAPSYTMTA